MYRAIVRRLIRRAFDDLGRNRLEEHRTRFAEGAVLRVHAGGETRTYVGHQQLKEGFETLRASTMQGPFELLDIWVNGWPWDTRVAVAWKRSRQVGGKRGIVYGMNRIRIQPARRGVTEEDVFIGDAPQCDASLHVFSQSAAAKGA